MKRRRRLYLAGVLLGATLLALLSPQGQWAVWGWLRGEAFYHGRPTSYWRPKVLDSSPLGYYPPAINLVARHLVARRPSPPGWVDRLRAWLRGGGGDAEEPFPVADPAAVPVLVELLRDEDAAVGAEAADALARIGPGAKTAVPALLDALRRGGTEGGPRAEAAANALRKIAPEAAGDAGGQAQSREERP
jgi:hypothetical protein